MSSLILVGASLPGSAASAEGPPPPADQVFESLDHAAEFGVIEPAMVKQLQAGEAAIAIVALEPSKVVKVYGTGDEAGVSMAAQLIKQMRVEVTKDVPVKPLELFELVPAFVTELSNPELALRLINQRHVLALLPDRLNQLHLEQSLNRIGQAQFALGGNLDGRGTAVVVLDTGADFRDPDFGLCTAPGVPATCRVPVAFDTAPDDGSPDDHGHGTNVSAVVAGVAPGAQVIPIDVFTNGTTDLGIRDRHAIAGLSWTLGNRYRYNIAAVNMSYGHDEYFTRVCGGTDFLNPYTSPFQMLRQAGVLPVVSAGNHAAQTGSFKSGVASPACTDGAIAVGATYTQDETADQTWSGCTDTAVVRLDQIACFSAGGPMLDLLAPGTRIEAAGITMNGTSQASPHAAAAVALLKQAAPHSTAYERQLQLTASNVPLMDLRTGLTHPRLDLLSAVRLAAPVPNDNRASKTVLFGASGRLAQTTWGASGEAGEPVHAGDPGGASAWFEWTAPLSLSAIITTEGSDFDTLLSVYEVDANDNLRLLADNDDEGAGLGSSKVTVNVTAGQRIQIAVDGKFDTARGFATTGHLNLTWNLPNDDIADAVSFPGTINAIGVARTGSNLRSSHQWGEPPHCGDRYASASVWYKWKPSTDQQVRIRLGGAQPMCLVVYSAPSVLSPPAFTDLTRVLSMSDDQGDPIDSGFSGLVGNTYWIAVDGVSFESACYPSGMCDYTTSAGPFGLQLN